MSFEEKLQNKKIKNTDDIVYGGIGYRECKNVQKEKRALVVFLHRNLDAEPAEIYKIERKEH